MPGDDGHLVAAPGELPRLSVDVLGDAAKHRVVVIGDDGDPHAGARASITVTPASWHSRYESASVREASGYTEGRMPIYEYLCPDGHRFEVVQRFSDEPVAVCEVCGKPVQRVLFAPAVHYKGKGFYATDYGRKGANGAKPDSGGSESGSKESGGIVRTAAATRAPSRSPRARTPRARTRRARAARARPRRRRATALPNPLRRRDYVQPAANVSPGAAASGADLPSTARMTRRFSSPPISSLAPPTDVIVPPRRQCSVLLARS